MIINKQTKSHTSASSFKMAWRLFFKPAWKFIFHLHWTYYSGFIIQSLMLFTSTLAMMIYRRRQLVNILNDFFPTHITSVCNMLNWFPCPYDVIWKNQCSEYKQFINEKKAWYTKYFNLYTELNIIFSYCNNFYRHVFTLELIGDLRHHRGSVLKTEEHDRAVMSVLCGMFSLLWLIKV
jgi:hypothetical protein